MCYRHENLQNLISWQAILACFYACETLINIFLFLHFECMVLSLHFMKVVLHNMINLDILIHFDVIIETAPKLNKNEIYFSDFFSEFVTCWILNQLDWRQIPWLFTKVLFVFYLVIITLPEKHPSLHQDL